MEMAHSPSVHVACVRIPCGPHELLKGQFRDFTFGFYVRKFGGILLRLFSHPKVGDFYGVWEHSEDIEQLNNFIFLLLILAKCLVQSILTLFS